MALQHSPRIVTNQLVLCLDAGNYRSYPGSGTAWTDISQTRATVTLYNTPTYNSANGGYLTFDGVNEYMEFNIGSANVSTTMTVEFFAKIKDDSANMVFAWGFYDFSMFYNSYVGYNTANSDWYGFTGTTGLKNNWAHYVLEMRSDVSYSNNKIYTNGTLRSLSQLQGTEGSKSFNNGVGTFGTWGGLNLYTPMDIALVRIYKGALQPQEVEGNFEAQRGRFGI